MTELRMKGGQPRSIYGELPGSILIQNMCTQECILCKMKLW